MKHIKLLALSLVAIIGMGSVAFAFDEPTFSSWNQKRNVGGRQSDPVITLKLVRFASRDTGETLGVFPSISSGDAVVYDLVSDDGVTVALTNTSGDASFAGIAVGTIQSADGGSTSAADDNGRRNWGWIAVHGRVLANTSAGGTNANVAGQPFYTSRDAGKVTGFSGSTTGVYVDANRVGRMRSGGFFYDAVTTGTQAVVQVTNE